MAQIVKNLPAMQETRVQTLGGEDTPEKGMATLSSILAWKISWTEELGRLQPMGSHRVGYDWASSTFRGEVRLKVKLYKMENFLFLRAGKVKVAQSCLTLCDPMDWNPPGSSVPEIFQARILERVAISLSRGSSWPRDQTQVSCIAGRFFTIWVTGKILFFVTL